jgi:hypothetical protein
VVGRTAARNSPDHPVLWGMRSFLYFTAATLAACVLLICFLDQPLA